MGAIRCWEHISKSGARHHPNWERWLCAERMRLCKRSEVRHDEDDELDQDL